MDQRQALLDLLLQYQPLDDKERISHEKIMDFVKINQKCFENDFAPGHITGSALVVDDQYESFLLTHHTKLNLWLQFGGHSDGHSVVSDTAMREAREESGLTSLTFSPLVDGIFDIDVHTIPMRGNLAEHFHYDVRFLVIGDKNEQFVLSTESKELRWVKLDDALRYNSRPEFMRMVNKVKYLRKQTLDRKI